MPPPPPRTDYQRSLLSLKCSIVPSGLVTVPPVSQNIRFLDLHSFTLFEVFDGNTISGSTESNESPWLEPIEIERDIY